MLNELENMKEALVRCGYSDSADEIAMGLGWTERLFDRGHDLLRLCPANVSAAATATHAADVAVVDARGGPGFGLLPAAMQLALSQSADHRVRKVCINNMLGGWIAPYVAFRLAQERHHAAVFWRSGAPGQHAEPPATLIMAAGAVGGKVRPMMIAPGEPWSNERRDKLLVGQVPLELIDGLHHLLSVFAQHGASTLAVAAAPEGMEAQFSTFVPLEDVIASFGLEDQAPNLLDAEGARSLA